jgi:hypothetical protein
LRLHDPATGTPTITLGLSPIVPTERFDLSPDGSVAAFGRYSGSGTTIVFDLTTQLVLASPTGSIPARQALSNQGRVLALVDTTDPSANHVRVLERQSNGYLEILDVPTPLDVYPRDLAVSDDGSTLVAAWGDSGTPNRAILRAYDVATGTMTMERIHVSNSGVLYPSDIAVSADGSRFAVGLTGPGASTEAEFAFYARDSSVPLAEHAAGGNVFSLDLSPDGRRCVLARIPTNRGYTSTSIEMYELGGEDLVVRGRPSIGETIDFEVHATPGATAFLLSAPRLAPHPIDLPGVGSLVLGPSLLQSAHLGAIPAGGVAAFPFSIANDPALVGRTTFHQVLTTSPRSLTNDWVSLTVLP